MESQGTPQALFLQIILKRKGSEEKERDEEEMRARQKEKKGNTEGWERRQNVNLDY